jgi:hypothetical protein
MKEVEELVSKLVEIILPDPESFLKVKETLTRIGVASKKENRLWQSCHILHKKGKYYIVHFKELFMLDGKESNFTDSDKGRRNTIANLLEEWGLVKIVNKSLSDLPRSPMSQIKVISFKDKPAWILESKYSIGKKKTDAA